MALTAHGNGAEPLARPGWTDLLCPAPAQPCAVGVEGGKNKPRPPMFHFSSSLQSISSTRSVWWITESQGVPSTVAPAWDLHPPSQFDSAVCSQSAAVVAVPQVPSEPPMLIYLLHSINT